MKASPRTAKAGSSPPLPTLYREDFEPTRIDMLRSISGQNGCLRWDYMCRKSFRSFSRRLVVYVCAARRQGHGKQTPEGFYTPTLSTERQEVEECHQAHIKALEKLERRLVLRIIDVKDQIIADTSTDRLVSGFRLARKLSAELNHYENERPVSCRADKELGAHFICEEEDEI